MLSYPDGTLAKGGGCVGTKVESFDLYWSFREFSVRDMFGGVGKVPRKSAPALCVSAPFDLDLLDCREGLRSACSEV